MIKDKVTLPIYMDYQSTTPVDPRVLETMLPYFTEKFGNPHSRNHSFGWEAEEAIELARNQVAQSIGADPKEIIFTSGATESDNIAIMGVADFYQEQRNHIVTLATEHKAVLDPCRQLAEKGFTVTYLPVQQDGIVDLNVLAEAITDKTSLVSVMMVNSEIGVVQPIKEIGEICRAKGALFHTDAAQAVGRLPIDVNDMNIDLLSISGHKVYAPKGIGALYVRRKPRIRVHPLVFGGGQERNIRSGTVPTPLVVGLGRALEISCENMQSESIRVKNLFDKFYTRIVEGIPDVYLNGSQDQRWHGNLNVSFAYIEGESLMMAIKDVAVSSGSACTSASLEPSYVLKALGVGEELAHTSIRFGLGRFTTESEVNYVLDILEQAVSKLRKMSPLWEMVQEGVDLDQVEWFEH